MDNKKYAQFPSEFVSVKAKSDEPWLKQYAQGATHRNGAYGVSGFNHLRKKVVRNNKYVAGTQSSEIYQSKLEGENNVANLALFYDTSNPLGTFVKNIVGQLQAQDYKVKFESLSPESVTKFDEEFKRIKFNSELASKEEEFKEAGIDISRHIQKTEVFQSDDEIEIHLELNLKDDAAMAMSIATQYVLDYNKYPDLERLILSDLVKHAWGCLYVEVNQDGNAVIRVPRLENMGFDYFEEEDASDCKYIYETRKLSINQLKVMAAGELTDKELYEAAKSGYGDGVWPYNRFESYYPNNFSNGLPWGNEKAIVYDIKIKSTNDEVGYLVEDKRSGGKKFVPADRMKKAPKNAEKITKPIENQYKVKYIPNIEKVFNYGICYSPREKKNARYVTNVTSDYIMFAPDVREMRTSSIVDNLIGKVDDWIFIKLNIMRMIAQAHPAGVAVDQVAVASAANGFGTGNMTPQGLIDIFTKRGVFIYSSMINGVQLQNQRPIQDTPESTLTSLERMQNEMMSILKEMEIISGVPYNTITTPDAKELVGNSKIAALNRNNTLRGIDIAYRNILSRGAAKVSACIQDSVSNGKSLMDYGQAIGYGNIDAIKAAKGIPLEEFGVKIEVAPDPQEQQDAIDALTLAIEKGMLRPSAVAFVRSQIRVNPKRAIKYMAIEERKFSELQQQQANERSIISAESTAKAGKEVEAAKIATINAEWDRRDANKTLEFRHDQGLSHQEYMQERALQFQKDQAKKEQIELATEDSDGDKESPYDKKNMPKASGTRMPQVTPG